MLDLTPSIYGDEKMKSARIGLASYLLVLLPTASALADATWKVFPCFGGGYVQNVLIAPSNPKVWYTYVDVGGPYRSDDAGRHWRPLHGNMPAEFRGISGDCLRSMSVDPRDADSFVMCSGNYFENPAGIFVSRDGGRTLPAGQSVRDH